MGIAVTGRGVCETDASGEEGKGGRGSERTGGSLALAAEGGVSEDEAAAAAGGGGRPLSGALLVVVTGGVRGLLADGWCILLPYWALGGVGVETRGFQCVSGL